jgi:aspergillopepsin I
MRSIFSLAIVAIMAICALAAPFPSTKALSKRGSFTVPVSARSDVRRTPRQELARTYAKYGWEIIITKPQSSSSSDGFGASSGDPSPFSNPFGSSGSSSSSSPASAAPSTYPSAASNSSTPAYTTGSSGNNDAASTAAASASSTSSSSSGSGSETGQVAASPEINDSEYLETVSIGTPAKKFALDFDTGSSDFWVFGNSLATSESSGHTTFDPSGSSSWQTYSGGSWQIQYGDGSSAAGTVGYDVVNIGGATATSQAVEIATTVSGSFVTDTANDGLVGLGFKSINQVVPQKQSTFFENVASQLKQNVFTANLEDGSAGSYTFGEIDSSQYSGDIHYTDIDSTNGFWQFNSNTYTIGSTQSSCTTCSPAIADTGTSLLLVDDDVAKAYYAQVSSAQLDDSQGGCVHSEFIFLVSSLLT